MSFRIFKALASLLGVTHAQKHVGPAYENPIQEPHIVHIQNSSMWKRIVRAGKPLIRDEEKIAKAEAKRERKQKRGW